MPNARYQYFYKRNLPHYQPLDATFFITFRLYGSLPAIVLKQLQEIRAKVINVASEEHNHQDYVNQNQAFTLIENYLDKSDSGQLWLREVQIAQLVNDAIHYRDGKEYGLEAFCIMPNHVHMVIRPLWAGDRYYPLAEILKSLKGYTARMANKILGRSGYFWQHESYDHAVRSEQDLMKIVQYVLDNPIKAGLKDHWIYSRW